MIRHPRRFHGPIIDRARIAEGGHPSDLSRGGGVTTLNLQEDSNGFRHWTCPCTTFVRKRWCEHTYKLYSEKIRLENDVVDTSPAVVIFSTPVLIVPCLLIPDDFNPDMLQVKVVWGDPKRENNNTFEFTGSENIGYVERGDGRGPLRTLILEWLPTLQALHPESMKCSSTYHSSGDSLLDEGSGPWMTEEERKKSYADAFNLLDTTRCTSCDEVGFIDTEEI